MGEQHTVSVARASAPVKPPYESHFEKRAAAAARYERDEGDLLPQPKKQLPTGRVPVELADAATLQVKKQSEATNFTATKKPKLHFSGNITVTDAPDEEVEEESTPVVAAAEAGVKVAVQSDEEAEPTVKAKATASQDEPAEAAETHEVPIVKVVGKRNRKIDIDVLSGAEALIHQATPASEPMPEVKQLAVTVEDDEKSVPLDPKATRLRNPHGVVGMQRQRISDRNPQGGTLQVDAVALSPLERGPIAGGSAVPIVCAVVVGLLVVGVMVGYQLEIEVATGEVMEGYKYRLDAIGASLPFAGSR